MTHALQAFNFQDLEVRIITIDGEPNFVANDVTAILGLTDGRKSVELLDEDERNTVPVIDSMGREQMTHVVNEAGLYTLIIKSRKKEAKAFKRWITHEVLPAIRKTGSYSIAPRDPINEIDRMLPAIASGMGVIRQEIEVQASRLAIVEDRQKQIDPQEIESRMVYLEKCKNLLVNGTKGKPQPVTFRAFWVELKELININSFKNRAALTVSSMDKCVSHARDWCEARKVKAPTLFEV